MVQIVQNTTYNNAYDGAAYFDKSNEKKKTFFIHLTLSVPISGEENKNKLNFYFHTSLKAFINLLRHQKEVWKWKFNLIFISIQLSEMHGTLREEIIYQAWKEGYLLEGNYFLVELKAVSLFYWDSNDHIWDVIM